MQGILKHLMSGSRKKNQTVWGWLMISPLLIGLIAFYFLPFFQNLFYSFTDLGDFGKWSVLSLENYELLFDDDEFLVALLNTLYYVAVCVPVTVAISLLLAIALNQKVKGMSLFRTLLFLPAVTMPAAIAMVWKWLYNNDFGLLNQILEYFGFGAVGWLSDPSVARISTSIAIIWSAVALKMIILLAGLQGIPQHLYEAARIDGAGAIKRFIHVTLPMMVPTLFFVSIIAFIETLQLFDVVYLMFGPESVVEENTMTIVYLFYKYAFDYNEKGYAAAISIVLFVITMLVTIVQVYAGKRLLSWQGR